MLWVALCNTLLAFSIPPQQTGPQSFSLEDFNSALNLSYSFITKQGVASLPRTPASPLQRYCSWLSGALSLLKLLGGGGPWVLELLLLSYQMKDGVLEAGWEQVLLLFALFLLCRRRLFACVFLSRICWHRNKDLMI